jgi:XRE family transcriptional regulator, regulator of sulfur utilization
MKIGSVIQDLREQKAIKQGDLADKLDISQTYLSQIECNKRIPNINLIEKISLEMNISLPFLLLLSIEEADVPVEKLAHYRLLEPMLRKFVTELVQHEND